METINPIHAQSHRFVSVDELSALLDTPRSTVAHWCAGTNPTFPPAIRLPNGRVLIERSDAEQWARGALRHNRIPEPVPGMDNNHNYQPDRTDDPGRFLTIDDIAELLGQSPETIGLWARRGGADYPRAIRLPNRRVLVDAADLETWLCGRKS